MLTNSIKSNFKEFYDLQINNWNINDKNWNIESQKFDLVICTRCPYFAKNPEDFMSECKRILKPGGHILVDWGLGDHWRFKDYKVGWVKDGEHEYAYKNDNFLWSCIWDDSFVNHDEYLRYESWVKKFGYKDLKLSIFKETPKVSNFNDISNGFDLSYDMIALWEEAPQLYIILYGNKN